MFKSFNLGTEPNISNGKSLNLTDIEQQIPSLVRSSIRSKEDSEISEKLFNEMVQCGMLQCVWRIAEDQVCKHCAALLPDHSENCAVVHYSGED